LTGHTTTYAFNSENQLVGVTRPNGESWTYKYDRPGRRIEKSSGTAPSQITRFVHDGDNILAILDGDNNPRQVFTNGLNIDEPLSMRSNSGVERYFHADALGSVRALTDASAAIVETYDYESYGRTVAKDAGGNALAPEQREGVLGYTGRYEDHESALQETRHRYYDREAGAFVSEDPIGLEGGGNLYVYGLSQPLKYGDSGGTFPVLIGAGLGLLTAGVGQAVGQYLAHGCVSGKDVAYAALAGAAGGAILPFVAAPGLIGIGAAGAVNAGVGGMQYLLTADDFKANELSEALGIGFITGAVGGPFRWPKRVLGPPAQHLIAMENATLANLSSSVGAGTIAGGLGAKPNCGCK
jgi:RHS repeat-associated protein